MALPARTCLQQDRRSTCVGQIVRFRKTVLFWRIEAVGSVCRKRYVLDDLDAIPFQAGDRSGVIGQKPDATQVQIKQDLGSDSHVPLDATRTLQRVQALPFLMEFERIGVLGLLDDKAEGILVQVDHGSKILFGNAPHRRAQRRRALA